MKSCYGNDIHAEMLYRVVTKYICSQVYEINASGFFLSHLSYCVKITDNKEFYSLNEIKRLPK